MINLKRVKNALKSEVTAYAHCDVPCGIYQPDDAVQAADTAIKMVEFILEAYEQEDSIEKANAIPRYVAQKEEHAKIAKETILGIWTDYFKPEHLQVYPELHELVWKVGKLGSHVKQNVDLEKAKEFKVAIQDIETIFWETKK
tara:strand:- start:877 stop:1305 length:429 start_codon:yes stop_codon:yes gene_type:complete